MLFEYNLTSLRKCPRDHQPTDKMCSSDIRVTNISKSFLPTRLWQKPAGMWNEITSLSPYVHCCGNLASLMLRCSQV